MTVSLGRMVVNYNSTVDQSTDNVQIITKNNVYAEDSSCVEGLRSQCFLYYSHRSVTLTGVVKY